MLPAPSIIGIEKTQILSRLKSDQTAKLIKTKRCSGGVLMVHEYKGASPISGKTFEISDSAIKRFKRNDYGFFDV